MSSPSSSPLSLRRLRQSRFVRELSRETRVSVDQLIQPLFVAEGLRERETVPGLTGVYRDTEQSLLKQIEADLERGVSKFLLFGVPAQKRREGFDFAFTARQIAEVRRQFGKNVFLSVDVCLCSSTEHGQCGVLDERGERVLNAETVRVLEQAALQYAQAGADCVAPSDMMDGRIGAIRNILDRSGCESTLLMSYAAKFNSRFYGPFRAAADSAPKAVGSQLRDRATYQIDPGNARDALACARRDAAEGADILMVKPGLPYLDILQTLSREIVDRPWAVYEVSGEFASIELLAREGLLGANAAQASADAHVESWTALARAGAQIIITYGARSGREWLAQRC